MNSIKNERDFVRTVAPHANVTTDMVASVGPVIEGAPARFVYETLRGLGVGGGVALDVTLGIETKQITTGTSHEIGGEG